MVQKYISQPENEMIGANALAIISNINAEEIRPITETIFPKYGVTEIAATDWYPVPMVMELYQLLDKLPNSGPNFVAIGIKVVDTGVFPPNIQTVHDAMNLLAASTDMALRNCDTTGWWKVDVLSPTHIVVEENTPYPHDLLYGYIYGLTRRYKPKEAGFKVIRTFKNEADPNADGAVYDITWG
jgi:hypothetical protein